MKLLQSPLSKITFALLIALTMFQCSIKAQDMSTVKTPSNGVADKWVKTTAFTNASIQVRPDLLLQNATLIIKGDRIIAVGSDVVIPADAEVVDLNGYFIFASFIDLNSAYGMPAVKPKKRSKTPKLKADNAFKSSNNDAIHPEVNASSSFKIDQKEAANLRSAGFGIVLSSQKNGIARGSGTLVDLSLERPMLIPQASMQFSFSKGNSVQDYPSSMMGSIALLRQHFTDFDWYRFHAKKPDLSLDAMKRNHRLPMIFEARDYQEAIRAQKLAKESGRSFIVVGSGDSRKDIPGLAIYNTRLIIPIKSQKASDLSNQYALSNISLEQLQDWKYSKANASYLASGNLPFSITFTGHNSHKDFFASLRQSIQYGLTREQAIEALTTNPAKWIKIGNEYGKLEAGYKANFFIANADVFTNKAQIVNHYIQGVDHSIAPTDLISPRGMYEIYTEKDTFRLKVSGNSPNLSASFGPAGSVLKKAKLTWTQNGMSIQQGSYFFYGNTMGQEIQGHYNHGSISGTWTSTLGSKEPKESFASLEKFELGSQARRAYNYQSKPKDFIIVNCTVWTCDENGIVPNLDVIIRNGKIAEMGENLDSSGLTVIDGTGLHLTPGLIDEHSHIAVSRGINESAQAISAEVRIQDVLNANDINIYRQVAGGTTTSHILHGSANPIGGQTALIKLKYGLPNRNLIFPTDHRFIKFALGENVKQSNWGDHQTVRFPQTRMGVEQVFVDGFTRAQKYSELRDKEEICVDWELEALKEILASQRFITCHSYQQGEINMLMHVADSFGFRVNTFTHILEGYKVADKLEAHGAAASTFSDWWAYKFEVNDAIPFNAAMLHQQGVLTGINSDDRDMGRRLNQEAAKAVKYGGVSEEDALKMVTINPAKMLHIDERVGSVTIGKDADLVLWTGNPLSIYSRVQTTWIDGTVFFDVNIDKEMQAWIAAEKERLILEMNSSTGSKKPFKENTSPEYHCDSIEAE